MTNRKPLTNEEYLLIEIDHTRKIIRLDKLPSELRKAHQQYVSAVASGLSQEQAKEMSTIHIIVDHPLQLRLPHEDWQAFLKHEQEHRDKLQSDPQYRQQWETQVAQFEKFIPD